LAMAAIYNCFSPFVDVALPILFVRVWGQGVGMLPLAPVWCEAAVMRPSGRGESCLPLAQGVRRDDGALGSPFVCAR
jgi:hypothetical protein